MITLYDSKGNKTTVLFPVDAQEAIATGNYFEVDPKELVKEKLEKEALDKKNKPISIVKPIVEEVKEPIVEEVKEPIVEEVKEPIVEEVKEPIVEEVIEKEPIVEEVIESIVEEVKDPVVRKRGRRV